MGMQGSEQANARAEWRAHWPVVLAAAAGYAASTIVTYSSSLFIAPMQEDLGWTRAQIMSGHSIAAFAGFLFAPFTGWFVDKFGPRRLGIAAVIAICMATALLSQTGPEVWQWRALWVPLAFAIVLIQPSVWTSAVTSLFNTGRGFALAVMLCGGSLSAMVTPKLADALIQAYGWRTAWIGLAMFWALVSLPLIVLFFTSANDRVRLAAPGAAPVRAARPPLAQSGMLSLRFVQILLGTVLIASVVVTFGVSIVPILSSRGLSREVAVNLTGILGISAIIGRLGIGYLLDRMHGRFLAAICVTMPIAAMAILIAMPGSMSAAALAVFIVGLSFGAELDVIAYLTSRYFDNANFGFLFGTIAGFMGLATANMPVTINAVYDQTGSYLPALWAAIPVCLTAAVLFLLLGPYPAGNAGQSELHAS